MLPLITENESTQAYSEIFSDLNTWRKGMVHYLKEENPEINAAIIDIATNTSLDPKAVALGAYMVYKMLEIADNEQGSAIEKFLE